MSSVVLIFSISITKIMSIIIVMIIISILLYDGKIYAKMFFVLLFVVMMFTSELLLAVTSMIAGFSSKLLSQPGIYNIVGIIMTNLILFWTVIFVIKLLKRKVDIVPFKYWLLISFVPIISILILLMNVWIIKSNIANNYVLVALILLGVLYINFAVFDLIDSYSKQIKLKVMEELFEREAENYKMLEITERELKTLKHDIKNHISSIEALLKQGEIDTANEHLRSLKTITNELGSIVYTGNLAIDAILNSKGVIAREFDLLYSIRATLLTPITIEPVDICIIFGNAIDNAIEACNRITDNSIEKYIFISIEQKDTYLVISFENSADTVHMDGETRYISLKADKSSHGFGLESIQKAVDKYKGNISTKFENNSFVLDIVLRDDKGKNETFVN